MDAEFFPCMKGLVAGVLCVCIRLGLNVRYSYCDAVLVFTFPFAGGVQYAIFIC